MPAPLRDHRPSRETTPEEPDPSKYLPVAAVQEMFSVWRAENDAVTKGRAQEKVRAAVQSGYITRGMQAWALALCRSDEASFNEFLSCVGPVFAHIGQPVRISVATPDRFNRAAQSEAEAKPAIDHELTGFEHYLEGALKARLAAM